MVAYFLQDDLAEELGEIFKDIRLKDPMGAASKVNIFKQALPIPPPDAMPDEEYDPDIIMQDEPLSDLENQEDPFPYAIVRISDGKIEDIDGDQKVTVLLLFGVIDRELGNQGHKDVLNLIHIVYERFAKNAILAKKYECVMPIEWTLQEEPSYPYFFGGMQLSFITHPIRREDPNI